jgi:hypothetical protein
MKVPASEFIRGAALAMTGWALAAHVPALAHHGGGIEYDQSTVDTVSGVATDFAFRFPHVQIEMDVTDENGNVENWIMGTRWTPTILRKHGWTRNSIQPGDEITVTYSPHVDSPTIGMMHTLEVNGEPLELDISN